jgi:hypothetical protein
MQVELKSRYDKTAPRKFAYIKQLPSTALIYSFHLQPLSTASIYSLYLQPLSTASIYSLRRHSGTSQLQVEQHDSITKSCTHPRQVFDLHKPILVYLVLSSKTSPFTSFGAMMAKVTTTPDSDDNRCSLREWTAVPTETEPAVSPECSQQPPLPESSSIRTDISSTPSLASRRATSIPTLTSKGNIPIQIQQIHPHEY